MARLTQEFFTKPDVVQVSKELIGCKLRTLIDGHLTEGLIIETEAYCGLTDKACHAHLNKKTKRTEIFYQEGGVAYVYLCYGIHHLFNIITGTRDEPKAVLIRAVLPTEGIPVMQSRRKGRSPLSDGPGKLTQAFGITKALNGVDLQKNTEVMILDEGLELDFDTTVRIGIDYAEEDALLPWRFVVPPEALQSLNFEG